MFCSTKKTTKRQKSRNKFNLPASTLKENPRRSSSDPYLSESVKNVRQTQKEPCPGNSQDTNLSTRKPVKNESQEKDNETHEDFNSDLLFEFNNSDGAHEEFYNCLCLNSSDSSEGEMNKQDVGSKINHPCCNTTSLQSSDNESEISESESESSTSSIWFMKSDSDTSVETAIDTGMEEDAQETDNNTLDNNPSDDYNDTNNSETSSEVDVTQFNEEPEEKPSSNEDIQELTNCEYSSQVDMINLTADTMLPSCNHQKKSKKIFFNTNEGSLITFEYTMQKGVASDINNCNEIFIDFVKKEHPNKMTQLVYQSGLKALKNNNQKQLHCVFMLDRDQQNRLLNIDSNDLSSTIEEPEISQEDKCSQDVSLVVDEKISSPSEDLGNSMITVENSVGQLEELTSNYEDSKSEQEVNGRLGEADILAYKDEIASINNENYCLRNVLQPLQCLDEVEIFENRLVQEQNLISSNSNSYESFYEDDLEKEMLTCVTIYKDIYKKCPPNLNRTAEPINNKQCFPKDARFLKKYPHVEEEIEDFTTLIVGSVASSNRVKGPSLLQADGITSSSNKENIKPSSNLTASRKSTEANLNKPNEDEIPNANRNKLLEKALNEKFHTVNRILRVTDNSVSQTFVQSNPQTPHVPLRSLNRRKGKQKPALSEFDERKILQAAVQEATPTPKSAQENISEDSKFEIDTESENGIVTEKITRSLSCSSLDTSITVSFLPSVKIDESNEQASKGSSPKGESSNESETSDDSTVVVLRKPQFLRSAVHLINNDDSSFVPRRLKKLKNLIKRIDNIGILECNAYIPARIKPKPIEDTADNNIRSVVPYTSTIELRDFVTGETKNTKKVTLVKTIEADDDSEDIQMVGSIVYNQLMQNEEQTPFAQNWQLAYDDNPENYVDVWQQPSTTGVENETETPSNETGVNIENSDLNAEAKEYVPPDYSFHPVDAGQYMNPDIYLVVDPAVIRRCYIPNSSTDPYENKQKFRLCPRQQKPFFSEGVYVTHNGNMRLNLRSFVNIDMTVDSGIRVSYPLMKIVLAISNNSEHTAMIHPYGRVYHYGNTIEANIYDAYTGVCKLAKMVDRAIFFSNDITREVNLVDKFGLHSQHSTTFFRLRDDFTPTVLTQTGRHGPQYNAEAVQMLEAAKYETCGSNHIIIIKNIKIIQYPTGNISIFRYNRRDHIQICPAEGYCKISTPSIHITATVDQTDIKPHIFIRKNDKRISFSSEKFFVRTEGQSAGYSTDNYIKYEYPI